MRSWGILGSIIILLATISSSWAANNSLDNFKSGFYVGIQAGSSQTRGVAGIDQIIEQYLQLTENTYGMVLTKRSRLGGRIFMGWNLFPYLAVETGAGIYPIRRGKVNSLYHAYHWKLHTYDLDLVVKGILPLEILSGKLAGWQLYAKAGYGWLLVHGRELTVQPYQAPDLYIFNKQRHVNSMLRPVFGAGLEYYFGRNFGVELSWWQVHSKDRTIYPWSEMVRRTPMINLWMIGLICRF